MDNLLKHNSTSMKTVVETYIIEETQELIYDNEKLDQWNNLVNELGLEGQTKVVKAEKSPLPFLWMNTALKKTFEELCPAKTPVESYDKTPIPVEALSMLALSKREGYFDKIEVWFNEKNPDPAIIGLKYTQGSGQWEKEFYAERYLLARWSDVKASLAELTDRARRLFILRRTNELNDSIKRQQRELEDMEIVANNQFGFAGAIDLPF